MTAGKIKDCLGDTNDKAFNFPLHVLFKDILLEQFLFYTSFWFTICEKAIKIGTGTKHKKNKSNF